MYDPSVDYVSALVDEIALEGLDGITLQGLWVRLVDRPNFNMAIDDNSKVFLWNIVRRLRDVEIFELPNPRKPLVLFNRYDFVDPELGTVLEPDYEVEDIYPFCPVDDQEKGIKGSSSNYDKQKDITEEARKMSLSEVVVKWGDKLILVAIQSARNAALMGDKVYAMLDITVKQYCFLERVGRSRFHGEVTQGKVSLQQLGEDPKSLFYLRKYLMKHKLICKQIHHQKTGLGQNCSGSLVHLPRFYVERKPKALFLTEKVIEILKSRPNYVAEYEEIRQQLGLVNSLKKLFKTNEFQRYVKTDLKLPYRTLYPNATPAEWKHKANDKEKSIRVIQLINPNMDISEMWQKYEDIDDDEDNTSGLLDQKAILLDRPLMQQAYYIIEEAGPEGCSQHELGFKMGQPKLEARTVCRNLLRRGMVSTFMKDVGRQRVFRFTSKIYEKEGEMIVQFKKEKEKTLSLVKTQQKKKNSFQEIVVQEESNKSLLQEEDISEQGAPPNEESRSSSTSKLELEVVEASSLSQGSANNISLDEEQLSNATKDNNTSVTIDAEEPEIETEIVEDGNSTCSSVMKNRTVSFTDELKQITWHMKKDIPAITYRLLKRANLIMEQVQMHKVIDDHAKLMKLINEEESREGYNVKIDKKSLLRLLGKLGKDGHVKNIRTVLRCGGKQKILNFVCEPNITTDHAVIQSAIEQAKMKFFIPSREKVKKPQDLIKLTEEGREDAQAFETEIINKSVMELKQMAPPSKGEAKTDELVYDRSVGRKYGFCPKFLRMQALHKFLFYIVYAYEGVDDLDQSQAIEQIIAKGYDISADLLAEFSTVFVPEVSWKMFINPLPNHIGWPPGWTLMCDILLRLPLSLFVKIFNISYVVPNIEYYLKHPIRQHFLVRHLPAPLRNNLLVARKYIFSIHEVVSRLCYVGLVQFGPQRLKEKDQVFIYVNCRTSLLDTTTSKPGYHQITEDGTYEQHSYLFQSLTDIDRYWYDMWNICVHTQLGGRMCVAGKDITLEVLHHKAAMIQAIQPKAPDEAPQLDNGNVPGDRRGAAGLDSAIFSHLKRNWNWNNNPIFVKNPKANEKKPEIQQRATRLARLKETSVRFRVGETLKRKNTEILQAATSSGKKKTKKSSKTVKQDDAETTKASTTKQKLKKYVRRVKPRKKLRDHRPYYDEIDQKALKLMNKLRVDWSPEEDTLLLLCKVAGMYLCTNPRKTILNFQIVRDILHKHIPTSKDKTSRACQRRILYVMKNPATSHSVALCLEEVRQDPMISEAFGKVGLELKRSAENSEELEKLMAEKFIELVEVLRDKFKMSAAESSFDTTIPDTIEEFKKQYTVLFPSASVKRRGKFYDVKNIVDIYCGIVNAMIHSSLCCISDKTSWAYQLFKVYQQYPDNLLRAAMGKLRSDQMVSLKKYYMKSFCKAGNYLPLSSSPYQLSITYYNLLQTKYQYEVFSESYAMFEKMLRNYVDRINVPLDVPSTSAASCNDNGFEVVATNGGSAAALVELFSGNYLNLHVEIPEQIIILDPRLSEKDEPYLRIFEHFRELLKGSKMAKELRSSSLFLCGASFDQLPETSDTRKRQSDESLEENAAKKAKLTDNGESIDSMQIQEDTADSVQIQEDTSDSVQLQDKGDNVQSEVDKTKDNDETLMDIDRTLESDRTVEDNSESDSNQTAAIMTRNQQQNALARAASRIALYMMQEDMKDSPLEETQHAHDFFVVNSCRVFCSLAEDVSSDSEKKRTQFHLGQYGLTIHISDNILPLKPSFIKQILEDITNHQIVPSAKITEEEIQERYKNEGRTDADWKDAQDLIQFVLEKKEVGATIKDLRESFSDNQNNSGMKLSEHLNLLTDMTVLVRCGVNTVHYVHKDVVRPWLIHSYKLFRLDKEKILTTKAKVLDTNIFSTHTNESLSKEENVHEEMQVEQTTGSQDDKLSSGREGGAQDGEKATDECNKMDGSKATENSSQEKRPRRRRRGLSRCNDVEDKVKQIDWSPMEQIQVKIRPWVRVDGSLNRRVLDRMLGAVLGHSMQYPCHTLNQFGERFSPALQPFHTRELIEILERIGCVKLFVVRKSCKTTLFSKPAKVKLELADGTEDESSVVIEPQVDAVLKLGQFIGNKKYAKDFLQNSVF